MQMKWPLIIAGVLSAVLVIIAFGIAYLAFAPGDTLLVIHFEGGGGIQFLGEKGDVFGLIGVAAAVGAINFALAVPLVRRRPFLAHVLGFFTVFLELLILLAVIAIVSVN